MSIPGESLLAPYSLGVPVVWIILVVMSYVLGTFPTAILVGRRRGLDPTKEGSGNPGATNVYRVAGKQAGAVVLLGDLLKGVLAASVGWMVDGRPLGFACWTAAVLGHIFPVFRRFRGGKGVATGGGGVMVLLWYVALCCLPAFVVVLKLTRKASLGSLAMTVMVAPLAAVFGRPGWEVAVCTGLAALIVARHWSNLVRLMAGQESVVSVLKG